MGKNAPTAPDPYKLAAAQTRMGVQTAAANAMMSNNYVTPWGSQTTGVTGWKKVKVGGKMVRVPVTTTKTKLAPDLDRGNKASMAGSADLAQMGRRMIGDYGKTARTMTYGTDFSTDRQRVEDAIMGRMQGGLDRDRAQLEERLASQGITIGSEPYRAAMDDFNRGVNDARLGAVMQGGQEQSRMVGLERDRAAFENEARDSSLNEIMGMLAGGRAQMPQFGPGNTQQLGAPDIAGLINQKYEADLQRYQQRQGNFMDILKFLPFGG